MIRVTKMLCLFLTSNDISMMLKKRYQILEKLKMQVSLKAVFMFLKILVNIEKIVHGNFPPIMAIIQSEN